MHIEVAGGQPQGFHNAVALALACVYTPAAASRRAAAESHDLNAPRDENHTRRRPDKTLGSQVQVAAADLA